MEMGCRTLGKTIPSGVLGIVGDGGDSRTLGSRASLGHECASDGKRANRV